MVATKHTTRATADQTAKGRQTKDTQYETVPDETPAPAELAPVEAAEAPTTPTAETTRTDTPLPAERAAIEPDPSLPNQPAKVKKLSALNAAARVLEESGQAMSCTELIAAMAAQGYWRSPRGRTPAGTLYSAVLRERKTKGDQARFLKTERGKFAWRGTVSAGR
jgi:HB1, ASXL, restriction endonuclease HTH domain